MSRDVSTAAYDLLVRLRPLQRRNTVVNEHVYFMRADELSSPALNDAGRSEGKSIKLFKLKPHDCILAKRAILVRAAVPSF
jgi:hypothetical protein